MQVALSHRNLPIVPYLRDRVALLATASLALQQQLRQQQQEQQQAAFNAIASAPIPDSSSSSPINMSTADTQSPIDTTAESSTPTTSSSTSSALSGAPATSPSAPPGAPFPLPPPSSTTTGANTSANTNTNQPGPVVTFLSSAQVDAVIQQALPLLPAATTQGSVRLPAGVNISYDIFDGLATNIQLWLEISVDRNRLLPDLIEQLDAILKEDSNALFLPLK